MTEFYADNLSKRMTELSADFDAAMGYGDWVTAKKLWLELLFWGSTVIREALGDRAEADALSAELKVYRPTRAGLPPAPFLKKYAYVFTGKSPWVCAAVEVREVIQIPGMSGMPGYSQEHYTTERKTVCGKVVSYPVKERFVSGGWPRLHELCPECTKLLVKAGIAMHSENHPDATKPDIQQGG